MSILSRTKLLFRVKSHAALDQLEDPMQTLDYAEQQQRVVLRNVGQGLIEVATARQRLSRQAEQLRKQIPYLEDQARRALDADREDLARIALQRKHAAQTELGDLADQLDEIRRDEQSLMTAHQQLSARIEEFRLQRTTASARHQSAAARVRVSETLTSVSDELAELSMAVGRAQESTERLQSRASALDALIASGVLTTPFSTTDAVERELRDIATQRAVDEEIATMRATQTERGTP